MIDRNRDHGDDSASIELTMPEREAKRVWNVSKETAVAETQMLLFGVELVSELTTGAAGDCETFVRRVIEMWDEYVGSDIDRTAFPFELEDDQ